MKKAPTGKIFEPSGGKYWATVLEFLGTAGSGHVSVLTGGLVMNGKLVVTGPGGGKVTMPDPCSQINTAALQVPSRRQVVTPELT